MADQLPAELALWPAWTPDEEQLGELELITSGAYPALSGYLTAADLAAVGARGELADGTPWPVPVTLIVPASALSPGAGPAGTVLPGTEPFSTGLPNAGSPNAGLSNAGLPNAGLPNAGLPSTELPGTGLPNAEPPGTEPPSPGRLVLQDPEGSPLAVLEITELTPADTSGTALRLAGPVTALRAPEHGPFRALRRTPAQVRTDLGPAPVLAYLTRRPLGQRQIGQLRHLAGQLRATILLLPLVAGPAALVTRPEALVRAVLAAARQLPASTLVVPVPLPPRADPAGELRARTVVAAAYGATHLLTDESGAGGVSRGRSGGTDFDLDLSKLGVEILAEGEWAYDPAAEVWRPLARIEPGMERGELSDGELGELLDSGKPVPSWLMSAEVAAELRRARPPRSARGVVVFCTGLSGSGKSTLARDLRDALLERGDRTVSLLDGDLVRRLLSAGLTFSRADRDLNIARIGYVAAEVARHGGIAICAPIAPYAAARAAVRAMVSEVGDFVLVHVSTPLAVCEARDRKGLYAKARAGVIGSFTGISDPYEEPDDADLVIDTSQVSRHEAVEAVLSYLHRGRWLG
ncbi:MAG TPA: adenylyl-sulfate kinase [Trebonia sp.]|nr:adenylyl-sulfate kinase [Trebonia sp.]